MAKPLDLLQGTLDMLMLKAVWLGPLHGYGILLRIQQISKDRLEIQPPACGANPKTIARQNTTASPPPSKKQKPDPDLAAVTALIKSPGIADDLPSLAHNENRG